MTTLISKEDETGFTTIFHISDLVSIHGRDDQWVAVFARGDWKATMEMRTDAKDAILPAWRKRLP